MPGWLRTLLIVLVSVLLASALVVWGLGARWDTGTSASVAGLVVAVGGFSIAITEVRKSTSAAKATKNAVAHTLKGVGAIQLIRTIEQLQQAAIDLEDAISKNDAGGARRMIRTWRTHASDAKGPLERRFGAALPALEVLDVSIEAARTTMAALRKGDDPGNESAAECLEAMEKAVDQLGPLREQLLPTMDELDEQA